MTKNAQRVPPAFTLAMFLRSLLAGVVIGLPLFLLRAPLWVFYVAPITMAPWIIWELLRLDAQERREQQAKTPEPNRPQETARRVA